MIVHQMTSWPALYSLVALWRVCRGPAWEFDQNSANIRFKHSWFWRLFCKDQAPISLLYFPSPGCFPLPYNEQIQPEKYQNWTNQWRHFQISEDEYLISIITLNQKFMKVKNWSLSTKVNISKFNQTNENMCILKENKSISFEKKWNQVKKKDLACRSCNCSCVFIFMSDNEDDKDNPACRSCSCSCVHDSVLKPASKLSCSAM